MFFGMFLRAWKHPFQRPGLQSALGRRTACLLAPRRSPGPVAIPYVNDSWLLCERRSAEASAVRLWVLKDFAAMSFIAHFLRASDHFVDVGAGIGSYSVLAAVASGARVSAIEPAAVQAALLSCNVICNALQSRVQVLRCGAGELSGAGVMQIDAFSRRRLVVDPCADAKAAVPVLRLDDIVGNDGVQVLKIDAAGDELAVLRGAHRVLARGSLYAVVVATNNGRHNARPCAHQVDALLERHGFVAADYDPFERQLLNPGVFAGKRLYIRKWQANTIQHRLQQASDLWPTVAWRL